MHLRLALTFSRRFAVACFALLLACPLPSTAEPESKLSEFEISALRTHGPWPGDANPVDPGNRLSSDPLAREIGEYLFNLPSLSRSGQISCATCHQSSRGFTDGRARAIGEQPHVRNTQGLLDLTRHRWFGWDGGADSLWAATLRPLLSPIEMGGTITSISEALQRDQRFTAAQPALARVAQSQTWQSGADESRVVLAGQAIGAYMLTLQSPRSEFDDFRDAVLANDAAGIDRYPKAAKTGMQLFLGKARCNVCHYGPNFSNAEFHDIGRPFIPSPGQIDPGRFRGITRVANDRYNQAGPFAGVAQAKTAERPAAKRLLQNQSHWGQWRTPSLRNLSFTAPYMHDGSLATLRDVVDWYADIDTTRLHSNGETILQPLGLNDTQREALVAFLETLSQRR
jgi:cytochrome c peroxidase